MMTLEREVGIKGSSLWVLSLGPVFLLENEFALCWGGVSTGEKFVPGGRAAASGDGFKGHDWRA